MVNNRPYYMCYKRQYNIVSTNHILTQIIKVKKYRCRAITPQRHFRFSILYLYNLRPVSDTYNTMSDFLLCKKLLTYSEASRLYRFLISYDSIAFQTSLRAYLEKCRRCFYIAHRCFLSLSEV